MRIIVLAAMIFASCTMPASARDLDVKFLIKHEGKVIGFHHVEARRDGEKATVETEIQMRVKFGPIPLFKYRHQSREIWNGGVLYTLDSRTNNDGDRASVSVQRVDGVLQIDGTDYAGPAPEGAYPSTYWSPALLDADALINTQTGEIIDVEIARVGETHAPNAQRATQFKVVGSLALDIWYEDKDWVGSKFIVDGEELTYELIASERQYAALEDFLD